MGTEGYTTLQKLIALLVMIIILHFAALPTFLKQFNKANHELETRVQYYNSSIIAADSEYKRLLNILTPEYLSKLPLDKQKYLLKTLDEQRMQSEMPFKKTEDFLNCSKNKSKQCEFEN